MAEATYREMKFTCSNCGQLIMEISGEITRYKLRVKDYYCKQCYYAVLQANKQFRIRLETINMEKRNK